MQKNELPAIRYDELKKRWRMDARDQGQRKTFYSIKETEKAVLADMKKQIFAWKAGEIDKSKIRLLNAWQEFLEQTKKSSSYSNYRQREQIGRNYILPLLKVKKVSDITKADWQNCINEAYDKKQLSRKSLQNIRGVISSFCTYAADDRMIDDSKIPRLRIPKQAIKGKRRILQPDELHRLLNEDGDPFYTNAYQFIVQTGLRRGEACGLKWTDIQNIKEKQKSYQLLSLDRSVDERLNISNGKTDSAKRFMILPDDVINLLDTHRKQLQVIGIISPWIFPNRSGEMMSPNVLTKTWIRFRNDHGYNASLHELRHTFVSITQNAMPDALLKRLVGHTRNTDTSGIYGHAVDGQLLEAQKIVNGVIKNIKNDVKVTVKK